MRSYTLIVIGAGAAGLVIAIGAARAGKKVLLIEKGPYGGDCTNFGCIPSKSLISAAHAAHALREGKKLGIDFSSQDFKADAALERVRGIVEEVRSHEDPDALAKIGVETLTGTATFDSAHVLKAGNETIFAQQIVIATGSYPFIPTIEGLQNTPFLTNETIFDLKEIPSSLVVLGGGPIGCELAQAFQRLGARVSLIHSHDTLLNKEEPEAQKAIAEQFKAEGISLYLNASAQTISHQNGSFQITLKNSEKLGAKELLVCIGRRPHVEGLKLEAAGIHFTEKGISVDAYGRTNVKHIWAVGDVAGAPFFTHWAENQARAVLASLLLPFPFKKKLSRKLSIPRTTFTDPEVASVGLSEEEAAKKHTTAVYHVPFSAVDRAITAGRTEGFVKVVTKKWSSQILGCTIVGPDAGDMLGELNLAMQAKIPLRKLANLIHPYPTYSLAIRKAADLWLTQTILGALKKK